MNDWLEMLLCRWGAWAVRRESSALGYGSVSPMFRDCPGDGFGHGFDPGFTPSDIIECDAAVTRLPAEYRRVVTIHYQQQGGIRRTARELGITFHRVRDLLHFAHGALHAMLDKREDDHQNMRQSDSLRIGA